MSQPAAPTTSPARPDPSSNSDSDEDAPSSTLATLSLSSSPTPPPSTSHPPTTPTPLLPSFTLDSIASLITSGRARRIIVLTGAGISVSCGIPDFRTPGTGLYSNLQRFDLPDPQSMFTLSYFRRNPLPFITLARELYPSLFTPSPTHHFLTLLHRHGLLLRCYTQNIDGLEYLANLPHHLLIQAHGGFHSAHCIDCDRDIDAAVNKADILAGRVSRCPTCGGLVKPRIVFFGESLPPAFHEGITRDFPQCDLLLCMGTSLTVQPFASLIDRVPATTPRLLINREEVGKGGEEEMDSDDEEQEEQLLQQLLRGLGRPVSQEERARWRAKLRGVIGGAGFRYHLSTNTRDVFVQADCDAGVRRLAALLGWGDELEEMVRSGYKGGGGMNEGEGVQGEGAEAVKEEVEKAAVAERAAKEEERKGGRTDGDQEGPAREESAGSQAGEAEVAKL